MHMFALTSGDALRLYELNVLIVFILAHVYNRLMTLVNCVGISPSYSKQLIRRSSVDASVVSGIFNTTITFAFCEGFPHTHLRMR